MKDVFFVYDTSCFYEIVILSYFMKFSNCDIVFCSLDGKPVRAMEGFSVNVDMSLKELKQEQIRSFVLPGGNISGINQVEIKSILRDLKGRNVLIAGICAAVDVLDDSGILQNVRSTHSTNEDIVNDKNIITARANAYVDFAIEVAKELELFVSEDDLQETIDFWKNYNRVQ
ncbi:MAG: DJ-1/PfpI family protein [Dorea sp.]